MRISEMFANKKPVFSLEIFPPKKQANIDTIYETVAELAALKPDFISVTYGAGGNMADNSTCEIASNIKKNHCIEGVAHLTCVNSSREDVKEMIGRFQQADIKKAIADEIRAKGAQELDQQARLGTTPRQLTDLIGSLCDLTSGSGDKGTPFVYIQGYFDTYVAD